MSMIGIQHVREDKMQWPFEIEYRKSKELYYSEMFELPYVPIPEKIIAYVKTSLVLRRLSIKLSDVANIAQKDWDEIRGFLERKLKEQGFLRADVLANALIEEAKARAYVLVKKYFGEEASSLIDKVAKYILAFALAERLVGEEEVYKREVSHDILLS